MPVGELLKGLFQRGHLKLTNTKRPYYLRSLSLVYACRQIADPPPEKQEELNDLKVLFEIIEKALEFGTSYFGEDSEATRRFEDAHQALSNYLATHKVRFTESKSQVIKAKAYAVGSSSWEEAGKQDRDAGASLNKLATALEKKMQELKNIPTIVVPMQIWHDIPINVKNSSEFQFNSHLLDLIKIEETANLNVLLHRLLEFAALPDKKGHSPLNIQIHLIQYPQFYPVFPSNTTSFESAARHWDGKKIKSIEPWENVKIIRKHRTLHLIMERKKQERAVKLQSGSQLPLSDIHKNVWPLEDSKDTVVVRNRTSSFSLSIWPSLISDSSTYASGSTASLSQASESPTRQIAENSSTTLVGESQSPPNQLPTTPQPQSPLAADLLPAMKPHSVQNLPSSPQPQLAARDGHPATSADKPPDEEEGEQGDDDSQISGTNLPSFTGRTIYNARGSNMAQVKGKKKEEKGLGNWFKQKLKKVANL